MQCNDRMLLNHLTPDCVIPSLKAGSKKQVLQELARKAADLTGQDESVIFDVLLERERLGTTGIGHGIAIPHGKIPALDRVYGVFARLERPIDFDSIDEQPVDLVFLLLAPSDCGADHLKALAKVSRLLRDRMLCEKMRGSTGADAIFALMNQVEDRTAA
jgi:nitrogen PTS system EIIA component